MVENELRRLSPREGRSPYCSYGLGVAWSHIPHGHAWISQAPWTSTVEDDLPMLNGRSGLITLSLIRVSEEAP